MKQIFFLTICLIFLITIVRAQLGADTPPSQDPPPNPKKIRSRDDLPPEWKEKLKVTEAEKLEYKDILKKTKGGLGKIWNNPCKYVKKVVDVQDVDCFQWIQYTTASAYMFGGRGSFAGVDLVKGEFVVKGFGAFYPILVDLGEVDFSRLNKETREVKMLSNFPLNYDTKLGKLGPAVPIAEFQSLRLSRNEPAKLNHTYLLRTAMYGEVLTLQSKVLNEQIIETVYAFQVVKQKDDIFTILWKNVEAKRVILKQSVYNPPITHRDM